MDGDVEKKIRRLRMSGLLANWDEYLRLAREGSWSHARLLEHVVGEEYEIKTENARKLRMKKAKIPEQFVFETYPFDRQPKLSKKRMANIYDSFDYMEKKRNIVWIGPTGTGKTGLATSFLAQAIEKGFGGGFVAFPDLVEQLYQSVADHSEAKLIKRFESFDCLLIDELGYVEVEPIQVGLFFSLMQKRHRRKTTLITSNLGFGQWSSFLKNDHLTAALIDRLTENSHVVNMKNCVSLRARFEET
jgi:DNA replication protein DnaC